MLPVTSIRGNIVDIFTESIFSGEIRIENGIIQEITPTDQPVSGYIVPGLIDAHVHIESSLLAPSQFARLAAIHGTVGTVSDPHEIANVLGVAGVKYMLSDAAKVPFHFAFGAPSCVPATDFESAGAVITAAEVRELLESDDIYYLAEMMNFPGVLNEDSQVMAKIAAAREIGKPIDGHAPGLRGKEAYKYAKAGISTDHECFTREEAEEKLQYGMKILVREGSAAKNFDTLLPLLRMHPEKMMFCSDDKHPDSLLEGHINLHVQRAINGGVPVMKVIKMATQNPIEHYSLPSGLLRVGDSADFIVVNNLADFRVNRTVIKGMEVAKDGKSLMANETPEIVNNFKRSPVKTEELRLTSKSSQFRIIDIVPGELITKSFTATLPKTGDLVQSDTEQDILKIVVVNRYQDAPISVGYVRGFGITKGALASSVAHDSHNIVAAGSSDELITKAINSVIQERGGLSLVTETSEEILPLPIAGLMSDGDGYAVADKYIAIDRASKELGSTLPAPFMTLSFLALLVIPELKLSDKGLFCGKSFEFVDVGVQ